MPPCKVCGEEIRFLREKDRWIPVEADTVDSGDERFSELDGHVRHLCRGQRRQFRLPKQTAAASIAAPVVVPKATIEDFAKKHSAQAAIIFWFTKDTFGFETFGATTEAVEQVKRTADAIKGQLARGILPCP